MPEFFVLIEEGEVISSVFHLTITVRCFLVLCCFLTEQNMINSLY